MHLLPLNSSPGWQLFFGHFHPVVVHLPIGILMIAFILELIRIKTKNDQLRHTIVIVLFYGFISAIISCLFGWLLSSGGDYDEDNLFWHQWMGISTAIVSGLLWLASKKSIFIPKVYTGMFVLMIMLLTITGHLGGNMTHGSGYLTANIPEPFHKWFGINSNQAKKRANITNINEAVIYADIIAPVLEVKCWSCHNASKKKGKFRMDTEELLMKGGRHGIVIKPNDAEGSELIKRVSLPEGDDKRMPAEGKSGLTEKEISLIKWWIAGGASFKAKVKELPQTETVKTYFKTLQGSAGVQNGNSMGDTANGTPPSPVFLQKIDTANAADINALKKENVIVSRVSQNMPFLELSMVNNSGFDDSRMKLITKLAPQVVWLKLQDTKITDAGLKELSNCKNLVRLNIEGTMISNNSISVLKQLPNLEYLNMVATKIDDNGLIELAGNKQLKNIYCWQTGVTQKGVDALYKLNPAIHVDFGSEKEIKK
jgi:uncharacterized membrane protein